MCWIREVEAIEHADQPDSSDSYAAPVVSVPDPTIELRGDWRNAASATKIVRIAASLSALRDQDHWSSLIFVRQQCMSRILAHCMHVALYNHGLLYQTLLGMRSQIHSHKLRFPIMSNQVSESRTLFHETINFLAVRYIWNSLTLFPAARAYYMPACMTVMQEPLLAHFTPRLYSFPISHIPQFMTLAIALIAWALCLLSVA